MTEPLIVAIDGPAGSGKSTVARALAERLGLEVLDTGAMYRAVTVLALRDGLDLDDADKVARIAEDAELEMGARVLAHDVDLTDELRTPEVNDAVSVVAAHPGVRRALVAAQRAWAVPRAGAIVEGRDIGTVVFPDATVKVFLTASHDERATAPRGRARVLGQAARRPRCGPRGLAAASGRRRHRARHDRPARSTRSSPRSWRWL